MKTIISTILVVAVLAVVVFGGKWSYDHFLGAREVAKQWAEDGMPDSLREATIKKMIDSKLQQVTEGEDSLARIRWDMDQTARDLRQLQSERTDAMTMLEHVRDLLARKQAAYTINGQSYAWSEVNTDALKRVAAVERVEQTIAVKQSLVESQRSATARLEKAVAQSRAELASMQSGFEDAKLQNKAAQMELDVAELVSRVGVTGVATDEVRRAMDDYNRRVALKEDQARRLLQNVQGPALIDYAAPGTSQDGIQAIERLQNRSAESQPATAVSP